MRIDIFAWWWSLRCQYGTQRVFIGPVHVWINPNYENK